MYARHCKLTIGSCSNIVACLWNTCDSVPTGVTQGMTFQVSVPWRHAGDVMSWVRRGLGRCYRVVICKCIRHQEANDKNEILVFMQEARKECQNSIGGCCWTLDGWQMLICCCQKEWESWMHEGRKGLEMNSR